MKTISLKLSDSFDTQLARLARQKGVSKSAVIREALERFLRTNGNKEQRSALALAEDLAGCLVGPEDLSVNKEYLQGFGQ